MEKKKIVNLQEHLEYQNKRLEIVEQLNDMSGHVLDSIIELAVSGKWKQWSDEQAIGTEFMFTEEMLRNTGDKNVDYLVELMDKILETIDLLK